MSRSSQWHIIAFSVLIAASVLLLPQEGARAQEALQPGEAYVTRFSGTITEGGRTVINTGGTVGSIIDLRPPGGAPQGEHWWDELQRTPVTAAQIGQVFGIALDDANPPNIYLTATSAFGLHRTPDNTNWMAGMWGPGGGPGSVYVLEVANGLRPRLLANITLNGRANTGAALGNIAYDRWNKQLYVSDLETGMIHRLRASDGADLGHYDHGASGRANFFDATTGAAGTLEPVAFDPASKARAGDCASGDFARTPSCWNFADFRRRVWGVGVRRDPASGEVRLFYSIWGSQGFGNADFAASGDDQRNSVWSVRIGPDGGIDTTSVRREFFLPDFFRSPEAIARSGRSHPVADIAFPAFGSQGVMLVAERGGVRNLGLDAESAFARPQESRVLRYELTPQGAWRLAGRYDVGYYDRKDEGPPYLRAGSSGGVSFGMGYGESWSIDTNRPDAFVWMTGDGLCSPKGLCFDRNSNAHNNASEVHGLQGRAEQPYEAAEPTTAFEPYPQPGPVTPATGPDRSFFIDTDINVDAGGGGIESELRRNDATRIGDVEIYQTAPSPEERPEQGPWYGPWEESWPWPVPEDEYPPLPPGEAWPELGIDKQAAECEQGIPCTLTITVTNHGPGVYNGPLHILDAPGVPNAFLIGASAGWTCEQPVVPGPIGCRHEPVTLAPGESVTLTLTIGWPLIILPGEPPAALEYWNCAFIVWPGALEGPARIRAIEAALLLLGFNPGPVDGVADAATQAAIDAYRAAHGLPPGGIDDALFNSLFPASSGLPGDGTADNDRDCAPIRIPLGPAIVPPGGEPLNIELQLEKQSIGVCRPGQRCDFRITVSNLGTDNYEGPVAINDTAGVIGGALIDPGSIHALTPEWTCEPHGAGNVRCAHAGPVVIELGHPIHFEIGVDVPAGAAGDTLRNCSFIAWPEMPLPGAVGDGHPANDFACVDAVLGEEAAPVEPANVELQLQKERPDECRPGETCRFHLNVCNLGTAPFDGPFVAEDTATVNGTGLPAASISSPHPTWSCTPAHGDTARCQPDAGTLQLAPHTESGDCHRIQIAVGLAADIAGDELENCTEIAWGEMAFPGGHDANDANDAQCVTVPIVRGEAAPEPEAVGLDLQLVKTAPEFCVAGESCRFDIVVTNNGPETYNGALFLQDIVPEGIESRGFTIYTGPGARYEWWTNSTFTATNPVSMPIDASRDFFINIPIPEDYAPETITNCAAVIYPRERINIDSWYSLAEIQLSFLGYEVGPIDILLDATTVNALRQFQRDHGLPETGALDAATLAALFPDSLGAPEGDRNNANNRSCVEVEVRRPGHDLAPEGDTTCQRGAACTLNVRIRNKGNKQFEGSAGLKGTLSPAVSITSATGETSGLTCNVTGTGAYACQGEHLSIKPGDAARLKLVINIPADFAPDKITHVKEMVWPDSKVKDRNPANDRHESIITIPGAEEPEPRCAAGWSEVNRDKAKALRAQGWEIREVTSAGKTILCAKAPPPPQCIGGRVVDGQCECPKGTERRQTATNAFRCVEIAPPPRCETGWSEVNRDKAKALRARGWEIREVTSAGTTILCAKAPPPPQCVGGRVVEGQCECPKGTERKQTAANAFTCVTPPPPITCTGGSVRDGQCICPKGTERKQTATNAFSCVKTAPPPRCDAGWSEVDRNRAKVLVAQGWQIREVTSGGQSILCARAPSLTCSGGHVQDGRCICPKGTERKQTATNAFSCVKTTPSLTCIGGSVVSGQCICPKGTTRKQTATNAFSCVKTSPPPPALICSGGTVQGGKCICPKGTVRQTVGKNQFRCSKAPSKK
ncbi:peptidoglycan-binding protein [Hyphomicrobium sp.]|uniref:peptidoglycan-binding protein n=2 Tax=Hyphomicrobium sp. TaxID=82 RepID=UPI0025BBF522|nr:peptidoglycan-binding protein [Hyphomicrobium sp.]